MSSAPALRLRGLEVRAGKTTLLGPLDLEVAPGEHVLLVGPSGSGKTTLLRALAGLALPARGSLELFGEAAADAGRNLVAPEKRRIGFLFQGGALWPHMSVRRTLAFVLAYAGVPRSRRRSRIGELLEWVELEGYEKRMPATLSGGEAQRLALARALAISPRLVLLDEPLGPLDAELRAALLARLAELHQELGWTTLHVTHDPGEAAWVATHSLRLEGGQIVESSALNGRGEEPA